MESEVQPCLLVQLEAHPENPDDLLKVIADVLCGVRFVAEEGSSDNSFVFFAKPYAFPSCVVWTSVHFKEHQRCKRIGSFTMTALNAQHHNAIILKNYDVAGYVKVDDTDSKCCLM